MKAVGQDWGWWREFLPPNRELGTPREGDMGYWVEKMRQEFGWSGRWTLRAWAGRVPHAGLWSFAHDAMKRFARRPNPVYFVRVLGTVARLYAQGYHRWSLLWAVAADRLGKVKGKLNRVTLLRHLAVTALYLRDLVLKEQRRRGRRDKAVNRWLVFPLDYLVGVTREVFGVHIRGRRHIHVLA